MLDSMFKKNIAAWYGKQKIENCHGNQSIAEMGGNSVEHESFFHLLEKALFSHRISVFGDYMIA